MVNGEEESDSGTLGAAGWLSMLPERVPPLRALDAADGWGGDAYVTFERDGVSCVRMNYQGDSRRDLTEMADTLQSWIGELPKGTASVHPNRRTLVFESCDRASALHRPQRFGVRGQPGHHAHPPVLGHVGLGG